MRDAGKRERETEKVGGVRVSAMMRGIEVKVRQRKSERERERMGDSTVERKGGRELNVRWVGCE